MSRQRVRVDGRQLEVSNLEKVLFPEVSFTKAQVIDYYVRIAPVLLPHLSGRPVTFTRWPDGVEGQAFFEKNSARHAPDWVRRVTIPSPGSSRGRETLDMVVLETVADLAWAANLAALELHVPQWQVGSKLQPALPDLLVLDLDPGPETGIAECCRLAERLRVRLVDDGLDPVVKTSGSARACRCTRRSGSTTASTPAGTPRRWPRSCRRRRRTRSCGGWRRCSGPARCSSTGARTTPPRRRWRRTRCGPGPDATVSTPIGWDEVEAVNEGADPGLLRFRTEEVLHRVEDYGDLFDVADRTRARLPEA